MTKLWNFITNNYATRCLLCEGNKTKKAVELN